MEAATANGGSLIPVTEKVNFSYCNKHKNHKNASVWYDFELTQKIQTPCLFRTEISAFIVQFSFHWWVHNFIQCGNNAIFFIMCA